MNLIVRVVLVVFCFFAAIACYVFGIPKGGILFLVLGLVLEGVFWTNLFKRKRKAN